MKKLFFTAAAWIAAVNCVLAQQDSDSIRMVELQGVEVISTRATEKTPVAYSTIRRDELEKVNTGVDLPFLLTTTPSLVATSEAGAGIGYTGVRIRGADATRINVTTNGIPMNDAESHGLFWVNTPDLAASLEDIQIQRGVGTSTNGAGAFGGSLNLKTQSLTPQPYAEVSGSYGSFNTHRESVNVGTGLVGNGKWAFNARLSNIGSDGYLDRASVSLKSYMFQAGYYGKSTIVKFLTFAGKEQTYHAWDGATRQQMSQNRKYNTAGEIQDEAGNVVGFYKDQTDNYTQSNYQVLLTQKLAPQWNLNVNLHFTDGDGYYEQYKNGQSLEKYSLSPFDIVDSDGNTQTVYYSNLIRRKMMDNWFGGGVFALNYEGERLSATLGGAANRYVGDHFGNVIWLQNYSGGAELFPDHEYYRNQGRKNDANIYLKANWQAVDGLYLYGDLQYRYINYKIHGRNDNWDKTIKAMQPLEVDNSYNFFNPKAGLMYDLNENWNFYGSVAVARKEPTRNNFTDAEPNEVPKAERLVDYEAGINYLSSLFSAGVNFYYMDYKDQLVLTGKVNHIGEALASNVPDSYRMGVEIVAGVKPLEWLRWDVNATFSSNKIKNYTDYHIDASGNEVATELGTTTIAYSPSVMFGSLITFSYKGFSAALQSNYVGEQYVTNSASKLGVDDTFGSPKKLVIDPYFVNNLRVDYTFRLRSFRSITVGCTVNNLFNEKYSSNAYVYSWAQNEDGVSKRVNQLYYFPQAGTNVLANITLRF